LRGQVVQRFDQAGVVTSNEYDFKGHLLQSQRQLAEEYKTAPNWKFDVLLETEIFTSRIQAIPLCYAAQLMHTVTFSTACYIVRTMFICFLSSTPIYSFHLSTSLFPKNSAVRIMLHANSIVYLIKKFFSAMFAAPIPKDKDYAILGL